MSISGCSTHPHALGDPHHRKSSPERSRASVRLFWCTSSGVRPFHPPRDSMWSGLGRRRCKLTGWLLTPSQHHGPTSVATRTGVLETLLLAHLVVCTACAFGGPPCTLSRYRLGTYDLQETVDHVSTACLEVHVVFYYYLII